MYFELPQGLFLSVCFPLFLYVPAYLQPLSGQQSLVTLTDPQGRGLGPSDSPWSHSPPCIRPGPRPPLSVPVASPAPGQAQQAPSTLPLVTPPRGLDLTVGEGHKEGTKTKYTHGAVCSPDERCGKTKLDVEWLVLQARLAGDSAWEGWHLSRTFNVPTCSQGREMRRGVAGSVCIHIIKH